MNDSYDRQHTTVEQIYQRQDRQSVKKLTITLTVCAVLALLNFGTRPISTDHTRGPRVIFDITSIIAAVAGIYATFGVLLNPSKLRLAKPSSRILLLIASAVLLAHTLLGVFSPVTRHLVRVNVTFYLQYG